MTFQTEFASLLGPRLEPEERGRLSAHAALVLRTSSQVANVRAAQEILQGSLLFGVYPSVGSCP